MAAAVLITLSLVAGGGCGGGSDSQTTQAGGSTTIAKTPEEAKALLLEAVRKEAIAQGLKPAAAQCAIDKLDASLDKDDLAAIMRNPDSLSPKLTREFTSAGHACARGA